MSLIEILNQAWGWTGLDAVDVVAENDFGNLLIEAADGSYWRLCPEDLRCEVIAPGRAQLDTILQNQDFLHDWYMQDLGQVAREQLGELADDDKYYLQTPAPLGGDYAADNLGRITLPELVLLSGELARRHKPTAIDELLAMAGPR